MKHVSFNIKYSTKWGQKLFVSGSIEELGYWEPVLAKEMTYTENDVWQLNIELPDSVVGFEYHYILNDNDQLIFEDRACSHNVSIIEEDTTYLLYDNWQFQPANYSFYSSAFQKCLWKHNISPTPHINSDKKIILNIEAPKIKDDESLFLTGDQSYIGNWNIHQSMALTHIEGSLWSIELDANKLTFPMEYKFVVCNHNKELRYWELDGNRILDFPDIAAKETLIVSGLIFRENQPHWHGAGTVVPVFSLRSYSSFGIGDLEDLKLLIDWSKKTSQSLIQILPMNDTIKDYSWKDSYPYSAISIYALNPIYISIRKLGPLKEDARNEFYAHKQNKLNNLIEIDFEEVLLNKIAYCKEYFAENRDYILSTEEFKSFFDKNEEWLIPYAAFSHLRDTYHTPDYTQWKEYSVYDKFSIRDLCSGDSIHYDNISFFYFLQYVLDKQFREVSEYARQNGIILKGDLPIGVNRMSVESWMEPQYFNLDSQAGAPPDDFSTNGQNWGFPTYNWDAMELDGYSWWNKRFKKLEDYFDAFRIDHILGFFRIWEIPSEYVQGLCGHFNPALPLSKDEIESFGLAFNELRFTSKYIRHDFIEELFGKLTEEIIDSYLAQSSEHHFVLKSFCDTQKKIASLFDGKNDDRSVKIKNGLFAICNEVLFLRDPRDPDKFHPRISANQSFMYRELDDEEKEAFDKLYNNFFYHRHNEFWKNIALRHLSPMVEGTKMLVCGEDLGMIPQSVPEVMKRLQILSLEIERMPKQQNKEFEDLTVLPYLSVCSTSTHDMSPLRSWWNEDHERTQRYYNNILKHSGLAPQDCSADLQSQIVWNHLSADSMLTIIPLQDWFGIDDSIKNPDAESERINIPAEANHYWRYRMHIPLEKLLAADHFNSKISDMILSSKR